MRVTIISVRKWNTRKRDGGKKRQKYTLRKHYTSCGLQVIFFAETFQNYTQKRNGTGAARQNRHQNLSNAQGSNYSVSPSKGFLLERMTLNTPL